MKRLIAAAFSLGMAAALGAVDIGGDFTMTNMGFPWGQSAAAPAARESFSPWNFLYGGGASLKQTFSEGLALETSYSLDTVQRSKFQALVNYDTGVLHIGIGPVFGLFNDLAYPMEAGFASAVRFEIPGAVFLSFRNDSSIGPALGSVGENTQGFNEISVGWYMKNVICTAKMSSSSFQIRDTADRVLSDTSTDYSFLADIFKKNQPFNIHISLGYRVVSKEFLSGGDSTKDSLGIIILGTKLVLRPARFLELGLGLDSGVYAFGLDNLTGRGPDADSSYLFKANVGFMLKTDKMSAVQTIVIDKGEDESGGAAEGTK